MTTLHRALACLLIAAFWAAGPTLADELKGRITFISIKASSIQITVDKKPQVVRFDKNTQFVNASSIKDLGPPDLIKVEFTPGQPATKITKMAINAAEGEESERVIETLAGIVAAQSPELQEGLQAFREKRPVNFKTKDENK